MNIYRNILKTSIGVVLQNKYFWFLGLFSAIFITDVYELLMQVLGSDISRGNFLLLNFFSVFFVGLNTGSMLGLMAFVKLIVVLAVFLSFTLLIFWLATVSQVALIKNSALAADGREHNFEDGMNFASKKFWSVLAYNMIFKVIIYLAFFAVTLPFVYFSFLANSIFYYIVFAFLFVVFMVLVMIFSFIIKYSIAFYVLGEDNFSTSFKKGWNLFWKNWLVSAEMATILFVISFFSTLIFVSFAFLSFLPFQYLMTISVAMQSLSGFILSLLVGFTIIGIIIGLVASILSAFITSSWTNLFLVLNKDGATSKLLRITKKFF